MKSIIDKALLKESLEYNGSISELKENLSLKKYRKFDLDWISDDEFKFTSEYSFGTIKLDYNPGYFDGINGYAKLTSLNNGKTKVDLSTKLRTEMYLFGALCFVVLLIVTLSNGKLPIWSLFIYPITIVWFWYVYRFQEKKLFEEVKTYLAD